MLRRTPPFDKLRAGAQGERRGIDQLIDYGTFLHVSYKPNGLNRRQVLWHR